MTQKVLVVDDEPSIVTLLTYNLEKEGYQTDVAEDGETAYQLALKESYDFILLDWMLPKLDGMEVVKKLRQQHVETPIIMLTAKEDTIDRIIGLEMGSDDYMVKPFSPREVIARMKAIQRRMKTTSPVKNEIQNGPIVVHMDTKQVFISGKEISLRKTEYKLLLCFLQHLDEPLSRDYLLEKIWHTDFVGESRIVDVHVSALREKIEENPKKPQYLQTVRGIGYRMVKIDE